MEKAGRTEKRERGGTPHDVDMFLSEDRGDRGQTEEDGIGLVQSVDCYEDPNYLREFPFEDLSPKMPSDSMMDGR
jgi:hypothetical protein